MEASRLRAELDEASNSLGAPSQGDAISTALTLKTLGQSWPDGSWEDLSALCRRINVGKALWVGYGPGWQKLDDRAQVDATTARAGIIILACYAATDSMSRGRRYKLLNAAFELIDLASLDEPALVAECLIELIEASDD